jgi:hypothetical protein
MNYYVGGTPIIRVRCKTEAGVLTDPTGLTVTITDPNGATLQSYVIGQLTHESTGVYKLPAFTVSTAGWHRVTATATGAVADVSYERFLVLAEPPVSPS